MYRGAGTREDELARATSGDKYTPEQRSLMLDDSIEREVDRDIRGLLSRFQRIRRLVERIARRKEEREALLPLRPEFKEAGQAQRDVARDIVFVRLNAVVDATNRLYDSFCEFNPAATEYPLTLSGWRAFEKQRRKELGELGFPLPQKYSVARQSNRLEPRGALASLFAPSTLLA